VTRVLPPEGPLSAIDFLLSLLADFNTSSILDFVESVEILSRPESFLLDFFFTVLLLISSVGAVVIISGAISVSSAYLIG
jgi:hypothetical protein